MRSFSTLRQHPGIFNGACRPTSFATTRFQMSISARRLPNETEPRRATEQLRDEYMEVTLSLSPVENFSAGTAQERPLSKVSNKILVFTAFLIIAALNVLIEH